MYKIIKKRYDGMCCIFSFVGGIVIINPIRIKESRGNFLMNLITIEHLSKIIYRKTAV